MVTSVQIVNTDVHLHSFYSSANRAGKLLDLLYLDYHTEPLLNFASDTYPVFVYLLSFRWKTFGRGIDIVAGYNRV